MSTLVSAGDVTRRDRMARLTRDMTALRSRVIRVQGEADMAVRDLRELQTELEALVREEPSK